MVTSGNPCSSSLLSFKLANYTDRTYIKHDELLFFIFAGHWAVWNICKHFEAARLLSFYNGFIDFPKLDSAAAGFFIVKHIFNFSPKLHKTIGVNTPIVFDFKVQILDIGKTSLLVSTKLSNGEGEILGENLYKYVYVNRITRRPKPLPDWWMEKMSPYKTVGFKGGMAKTPVPVLPDGAFQYKVKMRHSDTDKNGHVNNSIYIRLCIDCGTKAAIKGYFRRFNSDMCHYSVLNIDAQYLGESNVNDELVVYTWQDALDDCVLHFLVYVEEKLVFYTSMKLDPLKNSRIKQKL